MDRPLPQQQEWAQRRFANLVPGNLATNFRIISVGGLLAPPGWAAVWTSLPDTPDGDSLTGVWSTDIPNMVAVMILVNPYKRNEAVRACRLSQALQDMFTNTMPPLFWVCHTVAPEIRPSKFGDATIIRNLVKATTGWGIDNVSTVEHEGFRLALEIRMMITKTGHMTHTLSNLLGRRQMMRQRKFQLRTRIQSAMWEYLAIRLGDGMIPRVDRAIPTGIPQQLSGWTVGRQCGHCTYGHKYLLTQPSSPNNPHDAQRVLKAVRKSQVVKNIVDLKCLKRSIEIMHQLTSDQWRHPGIARLHQVFHSTSHIFMLMEFGGHQTLFCWLQLREQAADEHVNFLPKVRAIISQTVAAVTHIHLGPEICHRDLKPETFIVDGADDEPGLRLKLTDFDLAAMMTHPCRTPCGSLPFVAPEVVLEQEYAGGPADIWSLSVLFLEVLCRVRILELALGLEVTANGGGDTEAVAKDIKAHFAVDGLASTLLEEHCQPELISLIPKVSPVLQQTMKVEPTHRWRASQLGAAFGEL
mmetsp:Transcript_100179/g.279110  ORF Transcript_100179/g.279110 Transcript_100179/m.279110 type:complete len:526 (-) Transcript_100179:136-1713(-)